jgi:hypothetical protein
MLHFDGALGVGDWVHWLLERAQSKRSIDIKATPCCWRRPSIALIVVTASHQSKYTIASKSSSIPFSMLALFCENCSAWTWFAMLRPDLHV